MLHNSHIKNQIQLRPLSGTSLLEPRAGKGKRPLMFTLTLTSLIDAFSILVIFLLSNYATSNQPLNLEGKMQLPMASKSTDLAMGTVVKINEGHYFIDDKEVAANDMPRKLYEIRQKVGNQDSNSLIIQADRKIQYASLSPVILAASHAGFEKFSFAVLQGGGTSK